MTQSSSGGSSAGNPAALRFESLLEWVTSQTGLSFAVNGRARQIFFDERSSVVGMPIPMIFVAGWQLTARPSTI